MRPAKLIAVLLLIVTGILGVLIFSAGAVIYTYEQNRLYRADFDDGSYILYSYDGNGNRTEKVFHEENAHFLITAGSSGGGTIGLFMSNTD